MLSIHTGVKKISKTNVYDLHLEKMNRFDIGFDIGKPWMKIAKSEVLFEQYRMTFKCDKYDIEV